MIALSILKLRILKEKGMAINREKIHDLIEVFYQPTFKTFYINSENGNSFIKPNAVFVSLGITTSMKVLEDITEVINSTEEYEASIVEISSKKIAGQFLNTVTSENPKQYKLSVFEDNIMNEEQSNLELERLKSLMSTDQDLEILKVYAPRVSRLQDLINKLTSTNGWNAHLIQDCGNGDYRIFHQFVNYRKDDETKIEYRVGIYVKEKNNN